MLLCLQDVSIRFVAASMLDFLQWCMQKVTAKQPGTRKNAAVLARDIAAVWTGLRGAIMVDYMPLPCDSMCAILESLIEDTTDSELLHI